MSCEVFCCEIFEVLQILVEGAEGEHLALFFSFLDLEPPLDHHLAGYFEKVSELLFRRMTVPVMRYVNIGGTKVLKTFLRHIDNYSVMQIVQRLMLPHIPFSITADPESINPGETQNYQCNWSYAEETCTLLCSRMLELGNVDVPSHVSDLLITVLQLSPADALILTHLCRKECVESIIAAAFVDDADTPSPGELPTPVQCVSFAAISVLESVVLRLGESFIPFADENRQVPTIDEQHSAEQVVKDCLDTFFSALEPYLPKINEQLQNYATKQPCGTIQGQTKATYPRLGHRGLQLVKFIESLVRLSNPSFDVHLCSSGVIRSATDLIFIFDLNSILHLSIQRIILMIIEGGPTRRKIQHHLLVECGVLRRIMDRIQAQIKDSSAGLPESASPTHLIRAPSMGHLIHVVQALHHNFQNENFDTSARQEEEELMGKLSNISLQPGGNFDGEKDEESQDDDDGAAGGGEKPAGGTDGEETSRGAKQGAEGGTPEAEKRELAAQQSLHSILEEGDLLDAWTTFVQDLVQHLETQAAAVQAEFEASNNQQAELAMHALGVQRLQDATGWSGKVGSQPLSSFS